MNENKHYTDSLYYELILTAKCFQLYGAQFFNAKNYPVTIDEFAVLDVIYCNPEICQRDLAKLILKDRANTGRLVETLEKKGFIQRALVTRNNRPIKQITLTLKGEETLKNITDNIRKNLEVIHNEVPESEVDRTCETLKKIQTALGKIIKTQI